MSDLPPLPEPDELGMDFDKGWDGVRAYGHTDAAMREYGRACERAAYEEAAALCDRFAERQMHPAECASAIRAMKGANHD